MKTEDQKVEQAVCDVVNVFYGGFYTGWPMPLRRYLMGRLERRLGGFSEANRAKSLREVIELGMDRERQERGKDVDTPVASGG